MRGAPRKLRAGDLALDHREGRLKRVHVPAGFAPLEKLHAEVRNTGSANFSLLDQARHDVPGIFHRDSAFVGPMELVEVDALHAQPLERDVAFAPNRLRLQSAPRHFHSILRVPFQAALREHVRPLSGGSVRRNRPTTSSECPRP